MKLKAAITVFACVGIATQAEAFNFGILIEPLRLAARGAFDVLGSLIAGTDLTAREALTCPVDEFQARVIAVNSLCQLRGNKKMADMCRVFGEDCIGLEGEWGCGAFDDEEGRRGCLFRPSHGVSASNIIFDHEIGENRQRGNNGGQCLFGRKVARFNQGRSITTGGDGNHEETSGADLGFKDISGFFLGSINNTMSQLHDTYLELDNIENGFDSEAMGTSDMVLKIVNMLRLTPPIPRWQCQACKGTCNILFSFKPSWRDVCKHDACVKYLGGYKGTEASPSCTLIG